MKVKVIRDFYDLKADKQRTADELFEATKKRVEEINSTRFGLLVEIVETKGAENETRKPKRTRKSSTKNKD